MTVTSNLNAEGTEDTAVEDEGLMVLLTRTVAPSTGSRPCAQIPADFPD